MYQVVYHEKKAKAKKPGSYVVQRKPKPMKTPKDFREYISIGDKEAISRYCREKHYAISFRKAGVYTIQKLNMGAAAKGHHILEKSIKETSVNSKEDFSYIPDELKGLVGHWDSSDNKSGIMKIKGLYLSRAGLRRLDLGKRLSSNAPGEGEDAKQIVSLDNLIEILFQRKNNTGSYTSIKSIMKDIDKFFPEELKQFPDIKYPKGMVDEAEQRKYTEQLKKLTIIARNIDIAKKDSLLKYSDFITGDYDMHDLAYISENPTTRGAVIMPSHAVKEGLNAALNGRTRPHSEFDRIQHGPQADYIHYIQAHRREEMHPELMKIDTPVAMCGPDGKWFRLDSEEDVREYYKKYGLNSQLFWPSGHEFDLRETSARIIRGETDR